jgi:hypothetical protein
MIYIGFSTKSHKLYARIICRHFRHTAPVVIIDDKCIIYQFIKPKTISLIAVKYKDLKILEQFGWKFVQYNKQFNIQHALKTHPITCVQFTKRAFGIKNITIQTPDGLLKYLQSE